MTQQTKKVPNPVSLDPDNQERDPSYLWEAPPPKGENVFFHFRVDPGMVRLVDEAIQSGTFRWKTRSDFARTAIAFFMREHVLPYQKDGRFDTYLQRRAALSRALSFSTEIGEINEFANSIIQATETALNSGDLEAAKEFFDSMLHRLQDSGPPEWVEAVTRRLKANPSCRRLMDLREEALAAVTKV